MAENKRNWDKWIENATMALGPAAVGAMAIKGLASMANSSDSKNTTKKQVGSAGRESAVQARKSDKEIREKFGKSGEMIQVDPKTRRLKRPPPPLY
jgi:hypothetical protein